MSVENDLKEDINGDNIELDTIPQLYKDLVDSHGLEFSFNKPFMISCSVLDIDKISLKSNKDIKKDVNLKCKLYFKSSKGEWQCERLFQAFDNLAKSLQDSPQLKGVILQQPPLRKYVNDILIYIIYSLYVIYIYTVILRSVEKNQTIDKFIQQKKIEYRDYLSSLIHRSPILSCKEVMNFIQLPPKIEKIVNKINKIESIPIRSGIMKKKGEKNKKYRSRFFVLSLNFLFKYFEDENTFQSGLESKGCIDLKYADEIKIIEPTNKKDRDKLFYFGIKQNKIDHELLRKATMNDLGLGNMSPDSTTNTINSTTKEGRLWKIQCFNKSENEEWVKILNSLVSHNISLIVEYSNNNNIDDDMYSYSNNNINNNNNNDIMDLTNFHAIKTNNNSNNNNHKPTPITPVRTKTDLQKKMQKLLISDKKVNKQFLQETIEMNNKKLMDAENEIKKLHIIINELKSHKTSLVDKLYKYPKPNVKLTPILRNCIFIYSKCLMMWYDDTEHKSTIAKMIHVNKIEYINNNIDNDINIAYKNKWY